MTMFVNGCQIDAEIAAVAARREVAQVRSCGSNNGSRRSIGNGLDDRYGDCRERLGIECDSLTHAVKHGRIESDVRIVRFDTLAEVTPGGVVLMLRKHNLREPLTGAVVRTDQDRCGDSERRGLIVAEPGRAGIGLPEIWVDRVVLTGDAVSVLDLALCREIVLLVDQHATRVRNTLDVVRGVIGRSAAGGLSGQCRTGAGAVC